MSSTFAWVDFEEKDRQIMIEVIKMFQETGNQDELGISTIWDIFSEIFFTGTTTIQNCFDYMIIVLWFYLRHEKSKTLSNQNAQGIYGGEVASINVWHRSDYTLGVISSTFNKAEELAITLKVCFKAGSKRILFPVATASDINTISPELFAKFQVSFYESPEDAVFKALGVE